MPVRKAYRAVWHRRQEFRRLGGRSQAAVRRNCKKSTCSSMILEAHLLHLAFLLSFSSFSVYFNSHLHLSVSLFREPVSSFPLSTLPFFLSVSSSRPSVSFSLHQVSSFFLSLFFLFFLFLLFLLLLYHLLWSQHPIVNPDKWPRFFSSPLSARLWSM